ncbi:MAG: DNA polymerase IV, partial [Clostridia bacterium]|nr:DNA polymerase IV [Clostridia bacterium]
MLSAEAENYINRRGVNEGRVVLHSDLNNFFASVECLKHKSLKAYPIAVCGSRDERHGIVLAKNNLAKKFGIKTGQVIWQARNLCPELIVLQPHYEEYAFYSEIIREIYRSFSDRVEPFGMDEAWIDLTGTEGVHNLSDGVEKANKIRKRVYEETGLTLSVGVSDNKTFAKLASDYKKPDAVTVFGPEEYLGIISKLAIGEMVYAGRSTQKRLKTFEIETIGDASRSSMSVFRSLLGKNGVSLYLNACGHDISRVAKVDDEDIIKSIGNSVTPPRDLCGVNDIKLMIHALSDKVCARLRNAKMRATVVQIHVRDTKLNVSERQCGLLPTDNELMLSETA